MDEMREYNEPNFVILDENRSSYIEPAPVKKKRGRKFLKALSIVLLAGIMGFVGGVAGFQYEASKIVPATNSGSQIVINPNEELNTAEAVAAKVIPSVVGISITKEISRSNLFGMSQGQVVQGVGTGFIVHEDGYIVTNSHVVGDGNAKTIVVQLTDGRELTGTVLWNDTTLDLAMVKIEANNLTVAELGDSSTVNIGAYAVAIGNPLGLAFDRSVTQGVISGLDRTISVSDSSSGKSVKMEGLIQTDASINSGNSGGPLLNSKGEVIGINSAKAASGEGLGFAIPINTAKPIVEEIMKTGSYKKAYIGVGIEDVSLFLQYYPDTNLGTKTGAYVSQIYEGSPASLAGIRQGDAIVGVNDKAITTKEQLIKEMFSYKPGDVVEIVLYRDGRKMTLEVTLGTSPS